jgi:hypothetical protein
MSESNIKIFLEELTYVASIPYNEAITTYSYYNNLSKELEKEKDIKSSLLFTKDKIINELKIELEEKKDKCFNLSLKNKELEQKEDIKSSLLFTKDKIINELKIELDDKNKIINDLKIELEEKNKCTICFNNTISHCCNPCGHTYCSDCIDKTDNCYICRSIIHNKIKLYL